MHAFGTSYVGIPTVAGAIARAEEAIAFDEHYRGLVLVDGERTDRVCCGYRHSRASAMCTCTVVVAASHRASPLKWIVYVRRLHAAQRQHYKCMSAVRDLHGAMQMLVS